ncbi:MAG TPA: crosslink repair DNA glycosylase YcaQ family protein, partial [Gemmatimonadales bacterium]|nr:crosslink repair DNA glycosylase YcaQ family protein [Gemmatimonadales bacterium]
MSQVPAERARRIAVAAQGLARPRPAGRVDLRHLRRVFAEVGVVQIDSVNVVARAHRLTLFSRLGGYEPALIARAFRHRELFEYWGHMASLLPVGDWPLFRSRMERIEPGNTTGRLMRDEPGYIERVWEEVRSRGPLTAADLEDPGDRSGPWWGWSKGKVALEWLFATGRVTVADRRNFTRYYDIPERVIPARILARPVPDRKE